jgi:hypothetical protein
MATKAIGKYRNRPKAKHHKKAGMTLPLAVLAGFAPLGFGLVSAGKRALAGDTAGASQELVIRTTGYNTDTKSWNGGVFMQTYGPILAGLVIHKLAGKLGVNRALAGAGVPFLRV